jgi:hypothetical protein
MQIDRRKNIAHFRRDHVELGQQFDFPAGDAGLDLQFAIWMFE